MEVFASGKRKAPGERPALHLFDDPPPVWIRFIDEDAQTGSMLGVARIIGDPDGKTGEFAVLVGDPWQGKGIGSNLLEKCLLIAEKQGFRTVYGIVLRENRNMLALGKKLGFEIHKEPGSEDGELVIHFGENRNGSHEP